MGMQQTQIEAAVAVSLKDIQNTATSERLGPAAGLYELPAAQAKDLFMGLMRALRLNRGVAEWPTCRTEAGTWAKAHACRKHFDSSGNVMTMWLTEGEQAPVANFSLNGRVFAEITQRAGTWLVELMPHWPKHDDDVMREMICFERNRLMTA